MTDSFTLLFLDPVRNAFYRHYFAKFLQWYVSKYSSPISPSRDGNTIFRANSRNKYRKKLHQWPPCPAPHLHTSRTFPRMIKTYHQYSGNFALRAALRRTYYFTYANTQISVISKKFCIKDTSFTFLFFFIASSGRMCSNIGRVTV